MKIWASIWAFVFDEVIYGGPPNLRISIVADFYFLILFFSFCILRWKHKERVKIGSIQPKAHPPLIGWVRTKKTPTLFILASKGKASD